MYTHAKRHKLVLAAGEGFAVDPSAKDRDIGGQAMRRTLAAVLPSSSSSLKHSDRRRSVEDGSPGQGQGDLSPAQPFPNGSLPTAKLIA